MMMMMMMMILCSSPPSVQVHRKPPYMQSIQVASLLGTDFSTKPFLVKAMTLFTRKFDKSKALSQVGGGTPCGAGAAARTRRRCMAALAKRGGQPGQLRARGPGHPALGPAGEQKKSGVGWGGVWWGGVGWGRVWWAPTRRHAYIHICTGMQRIQMPGLRCIPLSKTFSVLRSRCLCDAESCATPTPQGGDVIKRALSRWMMGGPYAGAHAAGLWPGMGSQPT